MRALVAALLLVSSVARADRLGACDARAHAPIDVAASGETPAGRLVCLGDELVCEHGPLTAALAQRTYEGNVAALKQAIAASRTSPRKVHCDVGAVGTCGALRYFQFVGALYHDEVAYYDAAGKLVSLVTSSVDYPAYCGGRAVYSVYGAAPACDRPLETERICGKQKRAPRLPNGAPAPAPPRSGKPKRGALPLTRSSERA